MRVACLWFNKPTPTHKLAELFLRFSPQICIQKEHAIFIEFGKCKRLYSEDNFLARAKILMNRLGEDPWVGVGADITEALALTKYRCSHIDKLPLESLLEFTDPFARDIVLQKSVINLINTFENLDIKSIGDFKRIPIGDLIARFGVLGRFCHQRITGKDFIHWPLWEPEEIISAKKEFLSYDGYGELDRVLFELKTQLDYIFARLYGRRQKAMKIHVQIKCEKISIRNDHERNFEFNFFAPQGSTKSTLRIFQERLGREFQKNPIFSPIELIETKVIKSVQFEGAQKNLFNNQEEKNEELNSLHNQLVEILGPDNVYQAELVADRRPEKSWKKFIGIPHAVNKNPISISEEIPERATYLCRYPLKIEVTAGFVYIKKQKYRIQHWNSDVERITGGWFEKPQDEILNTYDRNYYLVELDGGQRVSVFETPSKQYYIHGYYG